MTTKQEILDYLSNQKDEFSETYGLSKLGLTGASAMGNQLKHGGIDIFVEFLPDAKEVRVKTKLLRRHLEKRFQTKIEIWREKYVKDYYKKGIFKDAILV